MKRFYESFVNALPEPMGSAVYILGIVSYILAILNRGDISYKYSQTWVFCVHWECSFVLFKGGGTIMNYNE
jgi:hypothetical protein